MVEDASMAFIFNVSTCRVQIRCMYKKSNHSGCTPSMLIANCYSSILLFLPVLCSLKAYYPVSSPIESVLIWEISAVIECLIIREDEDKSFIKLDHLFWVLHYFRHLSALFFSSNKDDSIGSILQYRRRYVSCFYTYPLNFSIERC